MNKAINDCDFEKGCQLASLVDVLAADLLDSLTIPGENDGW